MSLFGAARPGSENARSLGSWLSLVLAVLALAAVGEIITRLGERSKRAKILAGRAPEELVTRPAKPPQYYALKPDLPGFTNSAGFRDLERSTSKPAGAYRVAVIGDSVSMQGALPFESLYPRRLQDRLKGDFAGVEMLNFAVTGYNIGQEASVLEHQALAYHPDLVLWQIHDNDGNHPVYESERGRYYDRPRSYLLRFLGMRIDHLRKKIFIRHRGLQGAGYEQQNMLFRWPSISSQLGHACEFLAARKIDLVVALYPSWPAGDDWASYGDAGIEMHRRLSAHLAGLGAEVVDLLPALMSEDPACYRVDPGDPWHPNAEGHERIAELLLPALRQHLQNRR